MEYRTKTYLAGDWDGDSDAIQQIHKWNDGDKWSFSFVDVHEFVQARDSSLYCSIKKSLDERMKVSKTFILIVGEKTTSVTKGSCQYCGSYNSWNSYCGRSMHVDYRSYITYECEKAYSDYLEGKMNIVVLYNSTSVNRSKCPEKLRYVGTHEAMCYEFYGHVLWDYQAVKKAIEQ